MYIINLCIGMTRVNNQTSLHDRHGSLTSKGAKNIIISNTKYNTTRSRHLYSVRSEQDQVFKMSYFIKKNSWLRN